jgi:hypothetical protein
MKQPLRLVELNRRDVYITPLGRRCVLIPGKEDKASRELFTFAYLELPGGFSFTSTNVGLLRREVRP